MPLKAGIFHRNGVQPPPKRVHGAAVGQARLRAGLVLLMLPGVSPALVPHSPAPRKEPRRKYRLCCLFSPPLTGTGACRPTPAIFAMCRDGEVSRAH